MISILFGLIMGIVHYYSEQFCLRCTAYYNHILSFSAGISVTYLFLELFPRFSEGATQISSSLFASILTGFVLLHLVEKYIYRHTPRSKLRKGLALEDSIVSFIYHFIVGIIIVLFTQQDLFQGILFFLPVLFYTAMSTLPVDQPQFKSVKLILATSTTLGVLFALYVYPEIPQTIYFVLLGLVIGVLTYTVIRHSIPPGKEGKPLYLVAGIILYGLLITIIRLLG